jgi:hypothetical protein
MPLPTWFQRVVLGRRWLAFVVMGLAFFVFGSGTLNLFFLLKANTDLLTMHGWEAAVDGGLQQLLELLLTGYVSMAAYVVFKACEHALVHHLVRTPPPAVMPAAMPAQDNSDTAHEDRSTAG